MIYNNLKVAWRNIWKSKLFTGINLLGLSTGLAACMLIGLYVANEYGYDRFHEKGGDIVRLTMDYNLSGTPDEAAVSGTKAGPEFKRTFPSVSESVRTYVNAGVITKDNERFKEDKILFADVPFFEVFSFGMLSGDPATALDAPEKIVLTQSTAEKYFGSENPMGKRLKYGKLDMTVTGVCKDAPQNSQIKFSVVTQFQNLGSNAKKEEWWSANWITYLLLNENTDQASLEKKINNYMDSEAIREQTGSQEPDYLNYKLEPLHSVHLHSSLAGFEPNGSITYIYIFLLITFLILLIAVANYTNLAVAQSFGRGSEIGTRKVLGATKRQIFWQFMGESALVTGLAVVIAVAIAISAIPFFNHISGKSFVAGDILKTQPVLLIAAFGLLTSFIAGLYPAVILAKSKIMNALKSGTIASHSSGAIIRKSLIIGQFAISIFLISLTSIIISQVNFVKKTNLGYDREHVVVLPMNRSMLDNFDITKEAFANVNGVKSVTASYETPEFIGWGDGVEAVGPNGKVDISLNAMPTDLDFAQTLGVELAAGRDFNRGDFSMMDTSNQSANFRQPYIINETLAKMIGWTPEEAVGQSIDNRAEGPVVGVIKDFHFTSLHEPVGPLIQFLNRDFSRVFMLKIDGVQLESTLAQLEQTWNTRIPERPFDFHFLDDDFNKLYEAEERSTALFKSASILAIILAALGLFGLAAFSIVKRTKEIGLRRVLGASISSISYLFIKKFILQVFLALLIAIPFAWIMGAKWLQDFAYKIDISWWHFAISGLLVASIAVVTIGFQSIKACFNNPVNSLRSE